MFLPQERLQWPRRRRASRGQVARKPQLLRKFLLLNSGARLFSNRVRERGLLRRLGGSRFRMAFSSGNLPAGPLLFVDKTPYGAHQMGNRDVNAPFPENLRDPMHGETTTVRLQDLVLILRATSPGASFSSSSSNSGWRSDGVLECGVLRKFGIAPA